MSYNVRFKIIQMLKEKGFTRDWEGGQMFRKGEASVIITSESWNIGSYRNTSWPGYSGKSLKQFAERIRGY